MAGITLLLHLIQNVNTALGIVRFAEHMNVLTKNIQQLMAKDLLLD